MGAKNQELIKLRDALKLSGKIEQAARKADLLKDKTLVETEEHKAMKKEFEELPYEVRRAVDKIKHEALFGTELNVGNGDDYDNDGGRPNRYTNLRPTGNNRQRSQSNRGGDRRDNRGGDRRDNDRGGDRNRDRDGGNDRRRDGGNDRRQDRGDGAGNERRKEGQNRTRQSKPVFNDETFPTL